MPIKFPELESKILKFWKDHKIFEKSLSARKKGARFVFFEGPPTANGKPGLHHVLARAFKDLIPRYKTMRGYLVERKAGWDTHGLPVELQVEKALGISGKPQIENLVPGNKFESIKLFNQKCKESVWQYQHIWESLTERMAYWVDLDDPYITYNNQYIESLWSILKKYWNDGLIYQDYKVVPYCSRCGTALSSHEVAQGYKDVTETSVYLKFKLLEEKNTFVLAWTTTPWTLPGNVALAVGAEIDYVKVKQGRDHYILAKDRLGILEGNYEIEEEFKGAKLSGKKYEPLFEVIPDANGKAFYVTTADFVSTADGTGVVHTAVMYGEDDFNLGKKIGLPTWHTVDEQGRFVAEVKKWAGRFVKEAEPEIIDDLKERKLLYKTESTTHSYPFCWRCDTVLLYYARMSWYIRVTDFRSDLLKNNQEINWVPANIKDGRFGDWLENVKDWAISRERYWGTPLPIWVCAKCQHQVCVGSQEELKRLSLNQVHEDLHRPFIDEVKLKCEKCSGEMNRIKEVLDVWFDSGAMPLAQWHYPFENQDKIDSGHAYPADYISEAIDQTRGWFYTLLAVATLLKRGTPYKNVVCLGHILDAKGQKMSKSKGNIIDPWMVMEKYGADALRWHLFTVNPPGEPKRFDLKNLEEGVKKVFLILWNVYSFYENYAGSQKLNFKFGSGSPLDVWLANRTEELVEKVTGHLDQYEIMEAGRLIAEYIDDLSTWYLRRSRDRFKSENLEEREQALRSLGNALMTLTKLMAPFTPFISEELYHRLSGQAESVHLEEWPARFMDVNPEVLESMRQVRKICELAHALRSQAGIKVRQVLAELKINQDLSKGLLDLIKDEINVKKVIFEKDFKAGKNWLEAQVGSMAISLDTKLTPQLKEDGLVREIVRNINDLRKSQKLTIHDRVKIDWFTKDKVLAEVMKKNHDQIAKEVLADKLVAVEELKAEELKINDYTLICSLVTV